MNTEISAIEKMNPIEIFQGDMLDSILKSIKKEVASEVPDVSTVKGRERIKSLAHKVARTKTTLDGMGKDLVSDWKNKSKLVDQSRKSARDFLDSLKEEVRRPLTEWEQLEVQRVESIKQRIEDIRNLMVAMDDGDNWLSSIVLKSNLSELKAINIDKSFEDFSNSAAQEKDFAITKLEESISKQETREAEQAELERLRIEAVEREQKERDEQIAKEAAEIASREERERAAAEIRASKEKEESAEREKLKAEQRLKDQENEAELQRVEALEKAERDKKDAIEAEQYRSQQEKIHEEQEKSRREADMKHRKTINNEALKCFEKGGLSKDDSKLTIELIAKKLIAHISINY